jgi:hypothetical protein
MGIWFGFANQMTGINVINVYADTIFEEIRKYNEVTNGLTSIECTYFMGVANFIGACMGPIALSLLNRRT